MTTKELIWRLILPLAVVTFGTLTKWWYVLPVDAPDTMMIGFPLAFVSDGWGSSMSFQIFILELILDFLIYFLFWFLLTILIKRYLAQIKVPKTLTGILWTVSTLIMTVAIWIASFSEQTFEIRRDWDMQIMVTGYKFTWAHIKIDPTLQSMTQERNKRMHNQYLLP